MYIIKKKITKNYEIFFQNTRYKNFKLTMPRIVTTDNTFFTKRRTIYCCFLSDEKLIRDTLDNGDIEKYNYLKKNAVSMDILFTVYGEIVREKHNLHIHHVVGTNNYHEFVVKFNFNRKRNVQKFRRLMNRKLRKYNRYLPRNRYGYVEVDHVG